MTYIQVTGRQSEPWQVVVVTWRNVMVIQSLDFDILSFVLLSSAEGLKEEGCFRFLHMAGPTTKPDPQLCFIRAGVKC